jgi:hypothetical protein
MMNVSWNEWQEMIKRPVVDMTREEIKRELAQHNRNKAWTGRYYEVQRELWRRDNIDNNKRMVTGSKDYENQGI